MESRGYTLSTDQLPEMAGQLRAGDRVLLSGTIYTARDAAHKRMFALLDAGEAVQEKLQDQARQEQKESKTLKLTEFVTVSELATMMDISVTQVISTLMGVGIMVSINQRLDAETINMVAEEFGFKTEYVSAEVQEAIVRNGACYFAAVGGAGALIAKCIETAEVIAFDELGCESVKRMTVKDFPITVAIDCVGGNLYETGRLQYQR